MYNKPPLTNDIRMCFIILSVTEYNVGSSNWNMIKNVYRHYWMLYAWLLLGFKLISNYYNSCTWLTLGDQWQTFCSETFLAYILFIKILLHLTCKNLHIKSLVCQHLPQYMFIKMRNVLSKIIFHFFLSSCLQ